MGGICRPLGPWGPFRGSSKSYCFHNNTDMLFALFTVLTFVQTLKSEHILDRSWPWHQIGQGHCANPHQPCAFSEYRFPYRCPPWSNKLWTSLCLGPLLLFRFIFGCAHSMQSFPDQGSNLHHSTNLSYSSVNTGSLTHCATKELHEYFYFVLEYNIFPRF